MKYCCNGLENAANNQLGQGFSVAVQAYGFQANFFLVYRSIDKCLERELSKQMKSQDTLSFKIAARNVIFYCPWCGKNLSRFYKNPDKLFWEGGDL